MSLHEGLAGRLLLALAGAAAAVVGLAWAVEVLEEGPKPTLRGGASVVGGGGSGAAEAGVAPFELQLPEYAEQLGFALTPLAGTLALADRLDQVPPDVAPVLEVLADGSVALRRGVPLAARPGLPSALSRDGHGAGLVLPASSLLAVTPRARGTLCGLLMRWFPQRPVPVGRLRPLGFGLGEPEWSRLLSWLP